MTVEFLGRWEFVRAMTRDFLTSVPADCLDTRPAPHFTPIREQAAHLAEVQGVYQLALRGEVVDWERKPEFAPTSLEVGDILGALTDRDRELSTFIADLGPSADRHRVAWYGSDLGLEGFGSVFIQHESLHHGQWAAYAALGGYARPPSWVINWGL